MRKRQTLGALGVMRAVCGSLAISLAGGGAALAEEDQDYHRRALQAFTEARYEQALQLFSLGYADTKQPELLIRIGQTYLKLGRNAEALQACESYTARVENPDPLYKGYAEQCIAEAKRPSVARPPSSTRGVPLSVAESPPLPPPTPTPTPTASTPPATDGGGILSATVATPVPAPPPVVALPPPVNLNADYDRCLRYQREGRTDAARSCYLNFLPGALRIGGVPEAADGPLLTQLQRFPEPSAAFPPHLRQYEEKRNTGVWAAGLTMWLCAMVPALAMAPLYYADQDPGNKNIYYTMMIPIVGPFIAGTWLPLTYAPGETRTRVVTEFTIPWIVADGLTQLVGFTMFLGGVQTRRLPIPPAVERVLANTRIAPYGGPDGGGVAAMGRF